MMMERPDDIWVIGEETEGPNESLAKTLRSVDAGMAYEYNC